MGLRDRLGITNPKGGSATRYTHGATVMDDARWEDWDGQKRQIFSRCQRNGDGTLADDEFGGKHPDAYGRGWVVEYENEMRAQLRQLRENRLHQSPTPTQAVSALFTFAQWVNDVQCSDPQGKASGSQVHRKAVPSIRNDPAAFHKRSIPSSTPASPSLAQQTGYQDSSCEASPNYNNGHRVQTTYEDYPSEAGLRFHNVTRVRSKVNHSSGAAEPSTSKTLKVPRKLSRVLTPSKALSALGSWTSPDAKCLKSSNVTPKKAATGLFPAAKPKSVVMSAQLKKPKCQNRSYSITQG